MSRNEEMKEWMRALMGETRPMTAEEFKASGIKEISSPSAEPKEEEYIFDDGSNPFEDVTFNGLADGAGEFPLWENDSHK